MTYIKEVKQYSEQDIEFVVKKALEDAKQSVIWSDEYYKHLSKKIIELLKQKHHNIHLTTSTTDYRG